MASHYRVPCSTPASLAICHEISEGSESPSEPKDHYYKACQDALWGGSRGPSLPPPIYSLYEFKGTSTLLLYVDRIVYPPLINTIPLPLPPPSTHLPIISTPKTVNTPVRHQHTCQLSTHLPVINVLVHVSITPVLLEMPGDERGVSSDV